MAFGQRRYLFETKPITSGGKVQLTAKELPKGERIHRIEVVADIAFTQGAAPVEVKARDMFRVVKECRLSKRHILQGNQLAWQTFLMTGHREPPQAFTGIAGNVFSRKIRWVLDFEDQRLRRKDAALPLSDFLVDDPLSLSFESIGGVGATVGPSTTFTGNVYAIAYTSDAVPGELPALLAHEYVQWTGQRIVLDSKARSIVDMYLYKEDGTPFTAAEVATLSLSIDGRPYDSLPGAPSDLCEAWNYHHAEGNDVEVDLTATPIAAERLSDTPGSAAGAGAAVSPEVIPILFVPKEGKILELPEAQKQCVISVTGTLSTFSVGVRYLEHRSEDQRQKGAKKAGVSGGAFRTRDDSGRLVVGRASAVMPIETVGG